MHGLASKALITAQLLCAGCESKAAQLSEPAASSITAPMTAAGKPSPVATTAPPERVLGTAPEGAGLVLGSPIPEITVKNLDGQPIKVAALGRGHALLVVFYRGGWCPFCNVQIRELTTGHREFVSRQVAIAMVSVDQPAEAARTEAKLVWRHVDPDYKVRPSIAQLLEVIDRHRPAKGVDR